MTNKDWALSETYQFVKAKLAAQDEGNSGPQEENFK
jgi:hypothetical protein